jgi:nitrogen-specific signal transduction histidine kinase
MKNSKARRNGSKESKKLVLHYMETLVNVARESFLILDANLKVVSANPIFYQSFQVSPKQTENKFLYKLGNGQWDIPKLKRLLDEILPRKKVVKDYEVKHIFQKIGEKTILLNARQIDSVQLIILAMEDISARKELEQKLSEHTKELETKVAERTKELAGRIKELEGLNKTMVGRELKMMELKKEIENLKKRKNGNGNHKNGRQK